MEIQLARYPTNGIPSICVCICTFKRPQFLTRLLETLHEQDTGGLFSYSIVVVDNDSSQSAHVVVSHFITRSKIDIKYCVEPQQNIARARNKAVNNAQGDLVAFIDDDEFPNRAWLLTLFKALREYGVDGVLGPVRPQYDEGAPKWFIKGKFFDRATYPTGLAVEWRIARTGNVLLKRSVFHGDDEPFRAEFRTGEDVDFFRRMIEKGHRFIWCDEAVVYEFVPAVRWKRTFLLRRALLRGAMWPQQPTFGLRDIAKSLIAIPIYLVLLPVTAIAGHHRFMKMLVSLCDHLGKLLALLGIRPIKEPYITE